jgi:hypothetical protein
MAFRKGQWVKLTRAYDFAQGTEGPGTVGIHIGPVMGPPSEQFNSIPEGVVGGTPEFEAWSRQREASRQPHPTLREVHLVHAQGGDGYRGGDTRLIAGIEEADLEAATRDDVPADRLSTYHPEWQPKA